MIGAHAPVQLDQPSGLHPGISGRGKHGENSSEFGWVIHLQGWETDDADRGRTLREGWVLRRVGGDVGDVEGQIYAE